MRRLAALFLTAFVLAATNPAHAADACSGTQCAAKGHAALQGYCPVAYSMGKAMKGDPKFSSMAAGKTYCFASADAKAMFDADPTKYQVAYDGWCTTSMSMGKSMKSDPKRFAVRGGRTYLFSSAKAKAAFDAMPEGVIQKADAQWSAMAGK